MEVAMYTLSKNRRLPLKTLCLMLLLSLLTSACGGVDAPKPKEPTENKDNPRQLNTAQMTESDDTQPSKPQRPADDRLLQNLSFDEAMQACNEQKRVYQKELGNHALCKRRAHRQINPSSTKRQARLTCQEHYLTCFRQQEAGNSEDSKKCGSLNLFTQLDHRCRATVGEMSNCLQRFATKLREHIDEASTCTRVTPDSRHLGSSIELDALKHCGEVTRKCPEFTRDKIDF